jgi:hypothetical protein
MFSLKANNNEIIRFLAFLLTIRDSHSSQYLKTYTFWDFRPYNFVCEYKPFITLFYPEDGGSWFLRKISNHLPKYSLSYNRRWQFLAEIAQSVKWLGYGLDSGWIEVRFPTVSRNFPASTTFTSALGPIQPPLEWVPRSFPLGVSGQCVKLTTHVPLKLG